MFNSIDNLFSDEKEQNLRSKLAKEIRKCIFTDDILERLNENDFSGLVEEEEEPMVLFSMIFPQLYRMLPHSASLGMLMII